jgi:hypothetical protein
MNYKIYEANIERLDKKIEQLRRRFAKLNVEIVYEKLNDEFVPYLNEYGCAKYRRFINVNVEGKAQINGWKIIGKLERVTNNQNLVTCFNFNYENLLNNYTNVEIKCEHCNTKQYRKYSYVLLNEETNETKQIGSSCLSNFTGMDAERYVAFLAQFEELATFEEISEGHTQEYHNVNDVLAVAIQIINGYGYKARINYNTDNMFVCENSDCTSRIVKEYILDGKISEEEYKGFKFVKNDKTLKDVEEVKTYWHNVEADSIYDSNVKLLIESGYVDNKRIGLITSCIVVKQKREEQAKRIAGLTSEYVGNVGDKIELNNCEIKRISSYDTDFGMVIIYKITNNGNTFIWKTSKDLELEDNKTYNIKGTIKAHNEFRDEKQTELTRCKIVA